MSTAVVNLMKVSQSSIIASNRIASFLSDELGIPLVDCREKIKPEYKTLIIVNGPMLYCSFREEMKSMVLRAQNVVWVMNDYAIIPPKFIKDKEPLYWSSCDPLPWQKNHIYTNWNKLTFDGTVPEYGKKRFNGLCYYGAFRKDRKEYFNKYFSTKLYSCLISSSKSGTDEFMKITKNATYFNSSHIIKDISGVAAVLYIEDKKSHSLYCSPANRYYEALSARSLQLFDSSVLGTFQRARIDVSPWVVDGPEGVVSFLQDPERHRKEQISALRVSDPRAELSDEIKALYGCMP